ncbi:hypothetical protein ACFQ08_08880 [Streptosporangium algeriense]|uniref:Uncharacterized protein n=1 Tax=Streptosporangium algeriense TaxID=1682748 RepID=A0ABW3DLA9_9ACTN
MPSWRMPLLTTAALAFALTGAPSPAMAISPSAHPAAAQQAAAPGAPPPGGTTGVEP